MYIFKYIFSKFYFLSYNVCESRAGVRVPRPAKHIPISAISQGEVAHASQEIARRFLLPIFNLNTSHSCASN